MANVHSYNKFLLCEDDKNSEYVQKSSSAIDKNSVIETIKKECSFYDFGNPKMLIHRGLNSTEPFLLIQPSKAERRSVGIATKNYYTFIIDNSLAWKDFPKRSRSVIGIQSEKFASLYGQVYIMVPFDNANFGICPKSDLIFSFDYLRSRKFDSIDFNDLLKNFYEDLFKDKLNDTSYEAMTECLSRFDNKIEQENIKNRVAKIKAFFMKEFWALFMKQDRLTFIDFVADTIFNPKSNNFKLITWNKNTKVPPGKEIWTDSNVILIKENFYNEIKKEFI